MPTHDNGYVSLTAQTANGVAYGEFLYTPPPLDELPAGYITTVAGVGQYTGDGRPAREAFVEAVTIAYDHRGNLYIA